jgi:acetoacetyl-CoA synthetase
MGTSEFYRVVEALPGVADSLVIDTSASGNEGKLLLFVVLGDGASLEQITAQVRQTTRSQLSPRHVPDEVIAVPVVPRTINGKKCEIPVKRILAGVPVERAVSKGALADPSSIEPFLELASRKPG